MAFTKTTWKIRRNIILAAVAVIGVLFYIGFEIGVRNLVLPSLSAGLEASSALRQIETEKLTIDEYVTGLETSYGDRNIKLDPQLGWDGQVVRYRACRDTECVDPFRIVLVGDSVSTDYSLAKGEDYVALLGRRSYGRDVEIVNAAVAGFGVYQMALKSERLLRGMPADLLLFAYIDNDLVRPASYYTWGMTRPTFAPTDQGLKLIPPRGMRDVLAQYRYADRYFYLGAWTLRHVWRDRRFYMLPAYVDFYKSIYLKVLKDLEELGARAGTRIVIVRLPGSFAFRSRDQAKSTFASALAEFGDGRGVEVADIEPCVRRTLRDRGLKFDGVFGVLHPKAVGHQILAACIGQEILVPALN